MIYFPNQGPVQLTCVRNTTAGSTAWRVNGTQFSLTQLSNNESTGHSRNGTSIVINTPTNSTEYICVLVFDDRPDIFSDPAYLYIAGMIRTYITLL